MLYSSHPEFRKFPGSGLLVTVQAGQQINAEVDEKDRNKARSG